MIVVVALGLAVVDVVTWTSLHSYLYGRVDEQLNGAGRQMTTYVARADAKSAAITPDSIGSRVSPDLYVAILSPSGHVVVARPSDAESPADPPPVLPASLPGLALAAGPVRSGTRTPAAYRPDRSSIGVGSVNGRGPVYRLQATPLTGGRILVVATPLDAVNATLDSLRAVELAVTLGVVAVLLVLLTLLIRQGLRPLEEMAQDADAIAAGDLSRRVRSTRGDGEIARLGRALNGMLEQIETAFAMRALSEERLRSFLADASHELRTPLTSIRGYAELLRKDAIGDGEARDRALSRIEKEAARMGVLVGDLAILAREGERPQPVPYRVDLAAVAAEVVADAKTMDAGRSIEFRADAEVPVAADDARLEQLVHNLIGNALAHTPAGTPVEVGVAVEGSQAVLQVRDRGPGMSPDQASQVFDRFYRGDAERLDGGSGLGLFIVATLARTFGGEASVDTALGQGSTFQVVLPVYPSDKNGNGAHRDARLN